ncbi:uncharacterized protein TNIN_285471 [Trichonephila inaurata madagascariensis]|uniref:PID domain-containing protein n=1 Tax=Trichonephila inaurata madagascariensis TaxID=2747483 RepID=A0A8X7CER1_9ARAC|nr:uncharacterized protein TNIN_285471 [Trichonephila inaurata madagascariensis]
MSLDSDLNAGFQVKYLGSISFTRKKRRPLKGIVSLQRPLLDLYTEARRRGENHRSIHPLALTQHLEICDYGLVVAEGTNRGETVITKVITPLSNVILWAAVRFHARIIKKRVFGAAFVPLACSDGVLDHKSYICLASKQRFLVSLTHPSVFACIYRSVSSPTTYECHAFVCATAEDALAVAGLATLASQQSDLPSVRRNLYLDPPRRRIAASVDSGTDYYTPSDVTSAPRDEEDRGYGPPFRENVIPRTDTEEESNSYASVVNKASSPSVGRRRYILGARSQYRSHPRKRFTNHREARALIGRCGAPGRPLPEDEELWRATLPPRREPDLLEDAQRLTPGYEQSEPDQAPSEVATPDTRYRNMSTMTETRPTTVNTKETDIKESYILPPTEVLAETIDLSSESALSANSSASSTAGWRPLLPEDAPTDNPPLVKYTYFGYETYARPTDSNRKVSGTTDNGTEFVIKPPLVEVHDNVRKPSFTKRMVEQRKPKSRKAHQKSGENHTEGIIKGNGTGKVTINVPYNNLRPDSRNSSASSRIVPHGVRSFHKNGHVRNWSSLSQTSASSSSSYRGMTTLPTSSHRSSHKGQQHHPQKVIRWSSEDRLPRRQSGGFFLSLKRLSIQSLTKAKHKTGKFISSMKTRLMGAKRSSADGSEDSAYDTSEVCLSPSGRQGSGSPSRQPAQRNAARRQQSWSFHDLRSAAVEKPVVRRSHNLHHRRKHRRRSRKAGQSSSSSDSGVEAAYHSDNSGRKSVSDPGRLANSNGVTRVQVQHGMGTGTFQRWSNTNIHEELGYIP